MLTHVACLPPVPAWCHQSRVALTSTATASRVISRRSFHKRANPFAQLSENLSHGLREGLRMRNRSLQFKCIQAIVNNNKLLWEYDTSNANPKAAVRRMASRIWKPNQDVMFDEDALARSKSTVSKVDRLWGKYNTRKAQWDELVTWKFESKNNDDKQTRYDQQRPRTKSDAQGYAFTQQQTNHAPTNQTETICGIDPITNRRVPPKVMATPGPSNRTAPDLDQPQSFTFESASSTEKGSTVQWSPMPESRCEEYALNHLPPDEPGESYERYQKQPPRPHNTTRSSQDLSGEFKDLEDYLGYKPNLFPQSKEAAIQATQDQGTYLRNRYQRNVAPKHDELDKYCPYRLTKDASIDQPKESNDLEKYGSTGLDSDLDSFDRPFAQYGDFQKYKDFRVSISDDIKYPESDVMEEYPREWEDKQATHEESNANNTTLLIPEKEDAERRVPLTGSFVRDFPEEFSHSWKEYSSPTKHSAKRDVSRLQKSNDREPRYSRSHSHGDLETALNRSLKLEPALERHNASPRTKESSRQHSTQKLVEERDFYLKEPQGRETLHSGECRDTKELKATKTYSSEMAQDSSRAAKAKAAAGSDPGAESPYHRDPEVDGIPKSGSDSSSPGSLPKPDPQVYKILAYDPTLQKISMAETTSVVHDQAVPLTPAEALLRLSNPTKFLPYFAPLQSEGFEILSGSGDILVFRKMRAGWTSAADGWPVNPIDMMGRPTALPNAAAFASPTGFVNYDVPQAEENGNGQSAFRSNIDVRREEPVFSGANGSHTNDSSRKSKKKKSIVKRIVVGCAWVAGVTYTLGVVGEHLSNRSDDKRGPKAP